MARLLACWELGLGHGHLSKLAPAARGLARLGHESWLAARDVVTAAAMPGQPFAGTVQAPIWVRGRAARLTLSYGQVIFDGGFQEEEGLTALVEAWLSLFSLVQPDAVYGDHAPASLLAAHVARLPAARLGSPFSCPPAQRPMPALMAWRQQTLAERAANDALPNRLIRAVCRHFKAPMLEDVHDLLATATPFLGSWPELDPFAPRTDSDYYGPMGGLAATQMPEWPDASGPKVFVYLPFHRPAAAPLIEALAARGWPVLWVSATPPPGALPGNILPETEPAEIGRVFAQAAVFATRVGHNAAADALVAGVPMLLLPDMLEAEIHARQIEAGGLGRRPAVLSAAAIGEVLDALVAADAPERAAAAAVKARIAAALPEDPEGLLARRMARALGLL